MEPIKPGDFVQVKGQSTPCEVISLKGNKVEVVMGSLKMAVKLDQIDKVQPPFIETVNNKIPHIEIDTKSKMLDFNFELDLRGKPVEEVHVLLTKWIDDALVIGVEEASILHGKGTGKLKETVRALLRKYKEVEKFSDETRENGGEGVTKVVFK